jgi:hypothetical protein
MAGTFAKATAIGGLPVPIAAIALRRPDRPCFPDFESRNVNRLHLISVRPARARGYDTFWMAEHHFQPKARN